MKLTRTPKNLDLEITGACNLRCRYRSHFSSEGDVDQDLSTEEWLAFLDEFGRCSVLEVCLQGGEPLIHPQIIEILELVCREEIGLILETNWVNCTPVIAGSIASCESPAVWVSIDGAERKPTNGCDVSRGLSTRLSEGSVTWWTRA